jgi:hypothetical protein
VGAGYAIRLGVTEFFDSLHSQEATMRTPLEYYNVYNNLTIPSVDGSSDLANGISVDHYLLGLDGTHQDERYRLGKKVEADFKAGKKADPNYTIKVRVSTANGIEEREFSNFVLGGKDDVLWPLLRYPYAGKGSPEAIQIVLQLAAADGPGAPPIVTPDKFQAYCDKWLGLDCNGYVGNYLRHEYQGVDWWDVEITKGKIAPDALITDIWKLAPGVERRTAADIDGGELNLLVMVDGSGKIVPGGSSGPGHIAISEPGDTSAANDLAVKLGEKTGTAIPSICVLESTGAIDAADGKRGLARSYYAYVDQPKMSGVMHMHRGLNKSLLNFRVKGMPWPAG